MQGWSLYCTDRCFASILARAEMFASKNSIVPSMVDGLGMVSGFLFALTVISFFRELVARER